MGCDIHLYKEKKVNGIWLTSEKWEGNKYDEYDVDYNDRFIDRDYDLFGLLADIRRDSRFNQKPKGFPIDACKEVKKRHDDWGLDAHSSSYLTKKELKDLYESLGDETVSISGKKDKEELKKLKKSLASDKPDFNLLYPYSQGSNIETDVFFDLQFPAKWVFNGLIKIIGYLKDEDGKDEDQRIVFWFDN